MSRHASESAAPGNPSPLGAAALLLLSPCPGLLAALVGGSRAIWNLTDPVQRTYLTPASRSVHVAVLVVVLTPFVVAVATAVRTRSRTGSWDRALRAAARRCALLGGAAVLAVVLTGGGF